MRHCNHAPLHPLRCPQAAHATHEESDENFALEYGLLSPREEGGHRAALMPPVGAHGDYGLGDNSDLPPGGTAGGAGGGRGAAGGGIDDEDLYGEYGDAYGGGYGDPYGAPLGDLDCSALPSPSTTAAAAAAEPRRALTQGPPPTRALSHAAPPKPSLSERVAAADALLGGRLSPPSAALVAATDGGAQPLQEVDPAVVADLRIAFDLIDANGNGVLSRAEVILATRRSSQIRRLMGLPSQLRADDGSQAQPYPYPYPYPYPSPNPSPHSSPYSSPYS